MNIINELTLATNDLATGVQTFKKLINEKALYVDKTAFLTKMILSKNVVWFLARPRRFGKSLTVSTFAALFKGQRDLFKGLAIESHLDEERFAPRPVIHLDMTNVSDFSRPLAFKDSLRYQTSLIAEEIGVKVDPNLAPGDMLTTLIRRSAKNSGRGVAILIDEYDAPFIAFMDRPNELEQIHEIMISYYSKIKSLDDYISFVFITGITKTAILSLNHLFNSYVDISSDSRYGALCGFTQGELLSRFARLISLTAENLRMAEEELLKKIEYFYNGFCFDGLTNLYNPFSTLLFFKKQDFQKFWFNAGSSKILADFLKNNHLTVEEFSGIAVRKDFASDPGEYSESNPKSFLYQAGYLSLKAGLKSDEFILDYPNHEVREAMSNLLVENFLGDALAYNIYFKLKEAFRDRNSSLIIEEFNILLANIPYNDYNEAKIKTKLALNSSGVNSGEFLYREFLYRSCLFSLLYGAGLKVLTEPRGSYGGSGLVVETGGRVWVMEIKVRPENESEPQALSEARDQIIAKRYVAAYANPICLGIVISDERRAITLWEDFGDLKEEAKV
jgi:hypothetical protein